MNPSISCIVVSYNVKQHLHRCLTSLLAAKQINDEIIVVDNASPDGSGDYVKEFFPQVRLVQMSTNAGFSKAINAGVKISQGDILFFLNPDAFLKDTNFADLRRILKRHKDAWALGFRQTDENETFQLSFGLWPNIPVELARCITQHRLDKGNEQLAAHLDALYQEPKTMAWVSGASLLVWRFAFEKISGFDERFFLFFEDIDFCLRLQKAGGVIYYEPNVTLVHHRGQSAKTNSYVAKTAYRDSQEYFWQKHGDFLTRTLMSIYSKARKMLVFQ